MAVCCGVVMAETVLASARPLTIVHVQTRMNRSGGAEENTWASCVHQARSGHTVHLVCGGASDVEGYMKQAANVRIHLIPSLIRSISLGRDWTAMRAMVDLFKQLAPDIVHTHTSKAGILGRLAARRARVPMIVHGVHILPFANVGPVARAAYLISEHAAAISTDHFIHVSQGTRDAYRETEIGKRKFHSVVRSGMNIEGFKNAPLPDDWRQILGVDGEEEKPTTILMMAVLEPRKRQHEFITAFAKYTRPGENIRLVIAGDGKERANLDALVTMLGLGDRVKLIGHRNDPEKLVALSDLSALASVREGLPRTIVQSLAGDKPAVVTPLPGIEEIIADEHNGIIVPSPDVDLVAQAAVAVANDHERLLRLTKGAQTTSVDDWAFDAMFAQLDAAYAMSMNDPAVAARLHLVRTQKPSFLPASQIA